MNLAGGLQHVVSVVAFLEFSWSLGAGGLDITSLVVRPSGSAPARKGLTVGEVVDHLRRLVTDDHLKVSGSLKNAESTNALIRKCVDKASVLLDLIKLQTTSLLLSEWQDFQSTWNNFCVDARVVALTKSFVQQGEELKQWLINLLSDAASPLNIQLNDLQVDAESCSSVRGAEIVTIKQDILLALGHRPDKKPTASRPPTRRRILPKSSLQSSDSSGNESPRGRTIRKKRRPHPSQRARPPQQSSEGDPAVQPSPWVALVKAKLAILLELTLVAPLELRLLKQLSYESIDSREDSIREAGSGTFDWMLDDTSAIELLPHMKNASESFITWLNSGRGVFHISGNAGAGKSTLMKLLRHHRRTQSELKAWAGDHSLIFSSFYFWNSGSKLQMSLEGLYRSLLLEVCRKCPDLIPGLFPDQWRMLATLARVNNVEEGLIGLQQINDAFSELLAMDVSAKYRMCFFIDGLDEYTGENVDYQALAKTIRQWGESDGVKLCVSARPYSEFLDTFDPTLRLHLHELTSQDISKYASDAFRDATGPRASNERQLIATIVQKSEGVFLWARVVIRSLVGLASRGVDEAQLQQRLETYPRDIHDLYDNMLESLEADEKIRSNQMLLLAVRNPFAQALNALWFSWIDALDSPSFPSAKRPYAAIEINARHAAVRLDLENLTKGLLEMHTDRRERKDGDQFYRQRIQFFHRTARDHLRSPERLKRIEESFGASDLTQIAARLRLAEIVLAGKYKKNPGADPRRRRLYFNYVRSLFSLRDDHGQRFQVPRIYMLSLRDDLEATMDPHKFSSPYAVSSYTSTANAGIIDEDPEKAASFLHLALCHGQHKYVLQELQHNATIGPQRVKDELSLVLSAAFGHRLVSPDLFQSLLAYDRSPLMKTKLRPPLGNDFLATKSSHISILTVFVATLAFSCLGESKLNAKQRTKSSEPKNMKDLFIMLSQLLRAAVQKRNSADGAMIEDKLGTFPFLCLLHNIEPNDNLEATEEVFYTTLGELALRYAPSEAEGLLSILDEINTHDLKATGSSITSADVHSHSWIIGQYKKGNAHFITHDHLEDYFCSRILTAEESISADENLFFRVY